MRAFVEDFFHCLGFWSLAPTPARFASASPRFDRAVRALPFAALTLAAPAAFALCAGAWLKLPTLATALLAIFALIAATGGLHEDGLADCADGFGAYEPARRLEIMKESRIGAYGASALILSIGLRASALASLEQRDLLFALSGLFAAAAVSRTVGLAPLFLLPPARPASLSRAMGAPRRGALAQAAFWAASLACAPLYFGASPPQAAGAAAASLCAALIVCEIARGKIGGHTGDVAGAAQNCAEIAYLLILSAGAAR